MTKRKIIIIGVSVLAVLVSLQGIGMSMAEQQNKINEAEFNQKMKSLKLYVSMSMEENANIKSIIHEILPTYFPK